VINLSQCKTMNLDDFRKLDLDRYAMEPKIDGWRMVFQVKQGSIKVSTRTGHDATGKLPAVERQLLELADTHGSYTLDGEVVYLDSTGAPDFNFTARCLGSGKEVCVEKQQDRGFLSLVAFDLLAVEGVDFRMLPWHERREGLELLVPEGDLSFLKAIPITPPSVETHTKNIETYGEGSVLKDMEAPYMGKRHKAWLKWKAEETHDVKVIGYKEGEGKFKGLIGAIIWQAPDGTTGACSGMDDVTREYISRNREALINRIIEVKHYGTLVEGWRHPQFVRFRDDK
jgi:bifunctional non-homologous end joining protein LigD